MKILYLTDGEIDFIQNNLSDSSNDENYKNIIERIQLIKDIPINFFIVDDYELWFAVSEDDIRQYYNQYNIKDGKDDEMVIQPFEFKHKETALPYIAMVYEYINRHNKYEPLLVGCRE